MLRQVSWVPPGAKNPSIILHCCLSLKWYSLCLFTLRLLGGGFPARILSFTLPFFRVLFGGLGHNYWDLFWVPLGVSWGSLGRLGSSLTTLGGHFGLSLRDLGVPWAQSGCISAAFLVTLGSNVGPKGHFCMLLGAAGWFFMIFAGIVYDSLLFYSLVVISGLLSLCFSCSLLAMSPPVCLRIVVL